jgi:ribosomal protein S18 acetylase RimI-like enzyme
MDAKLRIVRAGAEDLDRVAPLFDLYRQFYRQPSDLAAARAFLSERLRRSESVIFLALLGAAGRPVGFTQLYPCFSSTAMKPLWILNDLYVASEARRKHVAEALMERARQWAAQSGAENLWLETAVDNHAAQSLYEKMGWERDLHYYRYNLWLRNSG